MNCVMCCQFQLLWLVQLCQVGVIALLFRYRNIVFSKIMIKVCNVLVADLSISLFSCVFCHTRTPLSYVVGFN